MDRGKLLPDLYNKHSTNFASVGTGYSAGDDDLTGCCGHVSGPPSDYEPDGAQVQPSAYRDAGSVMEHLWGQASPLLRSRQPLQ